MIETLKKIIAEKRDTPSLFKRNIVKEYLQVVVLSFIYSNPEYNGLIFYGGFCLRHCFGLERLSEDLDFVDVEKKVDINKIANSLKVFYKKSIS